MGVTARGVSTVRTRLHGCWGSVQTGVAREAASRRTRVANYFASVIGGLNHTFRQRVGRLLRTTLSFSKKLEKHIGAIWLLVHQYHASVGS